MKEERYLRIADLVRSYCMDHPAGASLNGGMMIHICGITGIADWQTKELQETRETVQSFLDTAVSHGWLTNTGLGLFYMVVDNSPWPSQYAHLATTTTTSTTTEPKMGDMGDLRERIAPHIRSYCLKNSYGASLRGGMLGHIIKATGITYRDSEKIAQELLEEAERQGWLVRKNVHQYMLSSVLDDKRKADTVWPDNWARSSSQIQQTGRVIRVQISLDSGQITTETFKS